MGVYATKKGNRWTTGKTGRPEGKPSGPPRTRGQGRQANAQGERRSRSRKGCCDAVGRLERRKWPPLVKSRSA